MANEEHDILAPSSAPIWGHCSGSVFAQSGKVDKVDERTRLGTAAHWVGSEVLNAFARKTDGSLLCSDYLGKQAPNGLVVDEEMVEGADIYVHDVLEVCQRFGALQSLLVEHRVHMPHIHPENGGTLDSAIYLPDKKLIFIWDYKHGHRECDPKENLQLIDYLAGLVNQYQINGAQDQEITVVARIVQPFCYYADGPIREWVCRLSDLRAHWNVLHSQANEALTNPTLTTGKWCRDCIAVGTCSAARKAAYNFIELVNQPYQMDEMRPRDLAVEREILKTGLAVAKARAEAIEDQLQHLVRDGDLESGLALETSLGRLEWTVPPAQARAVFLQFGVDIDKEAVQTPTQAKAAVPKELRPHVDQILKNFTHRPAGALKLVPADQSRTARAFRKS